jgi:multidrug efflux pump subunit AcrA (membrane-fusion protein)
MKYLPTIYNRLCCFIGTCVLLALLSSCSNQSTTDEGETEADAHTPVAVTTIDYGPLADSLELNATSSFLQKNYVKANATGYLQKVNVQLGRYVNKGQLLFTIKTKEAQSIGNTINVLDTTFKFSGVNAIRASRNGFITPLQHQVGDYITIAV